MALALGVGRDLIFGEDLLRGFTARRRGVTGSCGGSSAGWGAIGFVDVLDSLLSCVLELIQFGCGLMEVIRIQTPIVAPPSSEATIPLLGIRENSSVSKNPLDLFLHGSRKGKQLLCGVSCLLGGQYPCTRHCLIPSVKVAVPAIPTVPTLIRVPRRSRRGTARLKALRGQHAALDPRMRPDWAAYGPARAALGVGIFGAGALWASDPAFAAEVQAQRAAATVGRSGGGGCGSAGSSGGDSGGGGGGCGGGG